MALNTTKLGPSGVNAIFNQYYCRDASRDELNYWSNKSDADLRPKLIPNSAAQLAKNKPSNAGSSQFSSASSTVGMPTLTPTNPNNPDTPVISGVAGSNNINSTTVSGGGVKTPQQLLDETYASAALKNPAIATLAKGGSTIEEIINGLSTGNISGLLDWQGKPFSVEDQQAALARGMEDNKLFYEAQQANDKATTEAALAQKQANYQDYLINSGESFKTDKTQMDQTAADSGVLFSGGRAQKQKNLSNAYAQDMATNQRNFSNDINTTARNYQYKYGNAAATGLNQYYNLGSNAYNAGTATGGVTSNAMSSVYNPSAYNFQGTVNTERRANANTRAAGYLWNKGNKLLATGANNQYN